MSEHLTEGVVDCEDPVLEIDEDHAGHVALEREAEALLAVRERLGGSKLGRDGVQLDVAAKVLRCLLAALSRIATTVHSLPSSTSGARAVSIESSLPSRRKSSRPEPPVIARALGPWSSSS